MNLWYITVLVITTLSPPEGYMQYTQGFKDEASCQAFLNKPGVKEQVEADIKWQTQKVLIELGDYTCMQRGEATEKNARFGHGAVDI